MSIEVFRLSWRSPPVAVVVLLFGILLIFTWPQVTMLVSLAIQFSLLLVLLLLVSVVTISDEGIVLYRINSLTWSSIVMVRRVTVLGLPYLLIKRKEGFRWWLPLYFQGARPIEAALAEKAPIGNPISMYAELKKI